MSVEKHTYKSMQSEVFFLLLSLCYVCTFNSHRNRRRRKRCKSKQRRRVVDDGVKQIEVMNINSNKSQFLLSLFFCAKPTELSDCRMVFKLHSVKRAFSPPRF